MRVGLSWDAGSEESPASSWKTLLTEITTADGLGFDSAWVQESRDAADACPAPSVLLTAAAPRTTSIQLRAAGRHVGRNTSPVRLAEEVAVLDLFSKGRAGIGFASANRQGVQPDHVHETIDFVLNAWSADELRYSGEHIRFPAHTPDDVPAGASTPQPTIPYLPQWEWGPAMPDFLAVTPKPLASHPPVCVEIDDDVTLEWAAHRGISPFISADVPTTTAIERLTRYRKVAEAARVPAWAVEVVVERRINPGGTSDDHALGGNPRELVEGIRTLAAKTGASHLVWRRTVEQKGRSDQLFQFTGEVQPLLQA